MKLISDLSIEIALIVSTAYENWNVFMIMDFSALIVISYIDLYYSQTIVDDLKQRIVKEKFKMVVIHKEFPAQQQPVQKISVWCLKGFNTFFKLVYYHFFPFIGLYFAVYFVEHY